jgi:O-antigen/teichoic acid export membrane protein
MQDMQVISLPGYLRVLRTKIIGEKFFQDVGILSVAGVSGAALSLGQSILIARWLQPELYGLVTLVMSYPNFIFGVFDARSGDASVKYLSESYARNDRERFLALSKFGHVLDLVIAITAFLVVLLTAKWAATNIARHPEIAVLIIVFAASFLPSALTRTCKATLHSLGRFAIVGWTEIAVQVFRTILVLSLVFTGLGVEGVIWGNAIAVFVAGFVQLGITWLLIYRLYGNTPLRGRWQALKGQRREILRFLAYSDLTVLIAMIPQQLDLLVLGYFRGPLDVSYYKLAKSFASVTGYISAPLTAVAYPEITKIWGSGDKESFRCRVRVLALKIGLPLGLVSLLSIAVVPFVLPVLVGSAFQSAIFATQLLLIASSLGLVFFWIRPFFLAQGRFRHWFISTGLVIILFGVMYPFIVLPFGHEGAAIWYLSMNVVGTGVALFFVKRDS